MDTAYVSALAALAGSTIGGFTSLAASWLTQHTQATAQRLAHELNRREELYENFMDEASTAFADALGRSDPDLGKIVHLYALVNRMRVLSSTTVVDEADGVMRTLMTTYNEPNRSLREIADGKGPVTFDPLRGFSEACRVERYAVTGMRLR